MLKGENSTPPDVIIYMLDMINQQIKNYIRQNGVTPLGCWTKVLDVLKVMVNSFQTTDRATGKALAQVKLNFRNNKLL